MPANQEIEAKFKVLDPELMQRLQRAPVLAANYPLSEARTIVNVDTYFDTPDLRLLRQGQTLRIRTENDQVLMTVKSVELNSPKGVHQRMEVERAAPDVTPDVVSVHFGQLPVDVAAALAANLDNRTVFKRLVRLKQVREKRDVRRPDVGARQWTGDDDEPVLGELSLDRVEVLRPVHGDGAIWASAGEFDAIEVELAEESERSDLKSLVAEIAKMPGLEPDSHNKLYRAFSALQTFGDSVEGVDAHRQHMAELCRRVWREQLLQMVLNEAGVRQSDDIEYVHDMRVATRRARAAARLYAGFFDPRSKRIKHYSDQLRATGRLLGQVRDLDVALDNLARYTAEHGETSDHGLAGLAALWQARRQRAHKALLKWLDGKEYKEFVAGFSRFCLAPGRDVPRFNAVAGEAPAPHQVRHVLPSMIMSRYETIRAFEVLFENGDETPVETLHALRIQCKYMRYHLEFNAGLLGSEGQALIDELKALQEHLGLLNDASVSVAMLADAQRRLSGASIDAYKSIQTAAVLRLSADVPGDLARFLSKETRSALALALANI